MNVKFTVTQRDKLDSIPITNGQLLYLADENLAYYDMLNNRLCINGMRLVDGMPDTGYEQILYIDVSTDPWACYLWSAQEEKFEAISGAIATEDTFGIVKPDGVTIVINEGVISAQTSAIGTTYIPDVTSGTQLGTIVAGGTSAVVYAPTTTFEQSIANGTEIGRIMADGQVKSIYAPTSTFTQDVSSGTRVGRIMADGDIKDIYAPTSTFTQLQSSGTEIGQIMADGTTSSIYAPTTTFTPSAVRGAKIGDILADGTSYSLYAPIATSDNVGVVKPDNVTIKVNSDGSIVADIKVIGSTYTPTQTSGTELGKFLANGSTKTLYAPTTTFTETVTSGTEIGQIMADGTTSSIYAPTTTFTQTVTSGTEIGKIMADGTVHSIYAPTSTFTQDVSSGTRIGRIMTDGTTKAIYAPTTTFSKTVTSGTEIGQIMADGTTSSIYAPTTTFTQTLTSGTEIGKIMADGTTKSLYAPTVNNATLTIQKNGSNVKTFTANASSNVTANITVPTKVSELTNDSGYGKVTGVKGNSETTYRTGNVNITKANIGLGNVPNPTVVSGTLNAGAKSLTLSNAAITTSSTLAIYATDPMLNYTGATVTAGKLVLTFSAQSAAKTIKVYVF